MALYTKNQPLGRKISIIVVCAILALAMTIPSVALLLNRGGDSSASSSSSSTDTTSSSETETTTLLSTSQGYAGAFSDLKNAQANSTTPEAYDATFCENYDNWIYSLRSYVSSNGVPDLDTVDQSFQLLVDSILDTQASSTVPGDYDRYLGSAYYAWAETLLDLSVSSKTDVTAQLPTCLSQGIAADTKALESAYQTDNACELANLYYWSGDTEAAISTIQTALDQDSTLAAGWYQLGNYYYSSGQTDQALSAYQNAADNDANGTAGVRDTAQQRIDEINAA